MEVIAHRLELDGPLPAQPDEGFRLLARPAAPAALRRRFGTRGAAKALAKLATRRRLLYVVMRDGGIAHHGWLLVEDDGVVIGPIHTEREHRRQGLAVIGLRLAVNAMLARGHRRFTISAAAANQASRGTIEKAGFETRWCCGPPENLVDDPGADERRRAT